MFQGVESYLCPSLHFRQGEYVEPKRPSTPQGLRAKVEHILITVSKPFAAPLDWNEVDREHTAWQSVVKTGRSPSWADAGFTTSLALAPHVSSGSAWRAENAERRLDGLGGSREYRAMKLRHVAVLFSRTRASTAVDRGEAA